MNISILCPTRKRREWFRRMYFSAMGTAREPTDLEFVIYVDDDDDAPLQARNIVVVQGPRLTLSCAWNVACEKASGDLFMHGGDDVVFRTAGWDQVIRAAFEPFPDGIAFVHGSDGSPPHAHVYGNGGGPHYGTHGFLHRRWVDAVGYFVPPHFSVDYNDLWLNEVADAVGRHVYLPDVLIEHMHWTWRKAPMDATYIEAHEKRLAGESRELYASLAGEREADVEKLRAVMNDS